MDSRISKILEIGCSGLVGVVLTLGAQYIFPTQQSNEINVIINGEKVTMTESDAANIINENESLKNQISQSIEFSDFSLKVDGDIKDKFNKGFLKINGREFITFDILNRITDNKISYSNNILSIKHPTGEKANLMEVCPPYDYSNDKRYNINSFKMGGKMYDGFSMKINMMEYVLISLQQKYANLEFDFGHIDGTNNENCTLNIYLDYKLEKTIEQHANDPVLHINVKLNYAQELKFEFISESSEYGLGNIKLTY